MAAVIPYGQLSVAGIERGKIVSALGGMSLGAARLPTDAVGVCSLTLTNVVPGSRVHVEVVSTGVALADQVAASSTVNLSLNVYAPGSPNNDWRIKIRNASGTPAYKPFETYATGIAGSVSIFVGQQLDE